MIRSTAWGHLRRQSERVPPRRRSTARCSRNPRAVRPLFRAAPPRARLTGVLGFSTMALPADDAAGLACRAHRGKRDVHAGASQNHDPRVGSHPARYRATRRPSTRRATRRPRGSGWLAVSVSSTDSAHDEIELHRRFECEQRLRHRLGGRLPSSRATRPSATSASISGGWGFNAAMSAAKRCPPRGPGLRCLEPGALLVEGTVLASPARRLGPASSWIIATSPGVVAAQALDHVHCPATQSPAPPALSSAGAIVGGIRSGQVFAARRARATDPAGRRRLRHCRRRPG